MSYEVSIVADSIGPNEARITTFQLKYPRMVHAELMTHRMFSRNASSTRAIPTAKMIEWIERDPAMPVYWGKNQKGMQAGCELDEWTIETCKKSWLLGRDDAVVRAKALMEAGVHKQIASRILEPWAHINVVVTATSFDNFFALRCHKAAMPEIQVLAVKMAKAYRDSAPVERPCWTGSPVTEASSPSWHLPYVTDDDRGQHDTLALLKLSTARCARVSYLTFEGKPPVVEKDIELHDQLKDNGHWSPFEHPGCAQPFSRNLRSGNFVGWTQYRQVLPKGVHESFGFSVLDEFADKEFVVL